jgi:outer membrane protein TolC
MRLPLFFKRGDSSDAARRERVEGLERAVTQSLRTLATAFGQLANVIEQRRLQRAGYEKQERYLERTDAAPVPKK